MRRLPNLRGLSPKQAVLVLAIVGALTFAERWLQPATPPSEGIERIRSAFVNEESGILVEGRAVVARVLPDDESGSRHQRFIIDLDSDHTVLVAHNIDLAPRAPVRVGDLVGFKGQYEWSEQGGVIHWTHHDPGDRRPGGWIEVDGKRYE